ncbi:MAG: bifunctional diaminohydroxyphosphoribosylaminopyrimidine deaminase/5-amino-6-(5-phosphoribosylamino)uracil reductase RibD [Candidatus Omnitrophota bacterium]
MAKSDNKLLDLTIKLARKGAGKTSPNPLVGAVVVKGHTIVGIGYHKKCGAVHAEVMALKKAAGKAKDATLYVNLEPCGHYGRTPPCTNAIIEAGIKRVVIGMKDPNPVNNGKGIRKLRAAGIVVFVAREPKKFEILNKVFCKYITKKLPYIIIKAAQSLDGKIAARTGKSQWITADPSRLYVQKLRARVDAVMIGVNTLLKDDPLLSLRCGGKTDATKPVKVVVDTHLRARPNLKIFSKLSPAPAIIATANVAYNKKVVEFKKKKVEILLCPQNRQGRIDLRFLMHKLAQKGIASVLVEGGGEIIASCFEEKLADEAIFFIAPKIIGGRTSVTSVEGEGIADLNKAIRIIERKYTKLKEDLVVEGYVQYKN